MKGSKTLVISWSLLSNRAACVYLIPGTWLAHAHLGGKMSAILFLNHGAPQRTLVPGFWLSAAPQKFPCPPKPVSHWPHSALLWLILIHSSGFNWGETPLGKHSWHHFYGQPLQILPSRFHQPSRSEFPSFTLEILASPSFSTLNWMLWAKGLHCLCIAESEK